MTYRQIERLRDSFEPYAERIYRKALNEQLKQVNLNYEQAHRHINEKPVIDAYRKVYGLVMPEFGKQTLRRFKSKKKDDEFLPNWDRVVNNYVSIELAVRIKGITDYSREIVEKLILQAIDEGLSIPQTQKLLRTKWRDMARFRAVRIARTEIISASNAGSLNGVLSLNRPVVRTWLATGDKRTRATHWEANNQKVMSGGSYVVGGETLRFPGDPQATAGNVINCRCAETFELI